MVLNGPHVDRLCEAVGAKESPTHALGAVCAPIEGWRKRDSYASSMADASEWPHAGTN